MDLSPIPNNIPVITPVIQAFGGLNGYWGQRGFEPLKAYCDSHPEYVTLSFVNQAPEHSDTNLPGTNFAGHCAGGTYGDSNLLSECYTIKEGIPYCKDRGVKILLSIGGVYNDAGSNYKVTTNDKGREFADFLYKAFGPYNEYSGTIRPFDSVDEDGNAVHAAVDGFDFDIEHDLPNGPYIAMINRLRELDEEITITGAPQCPTSDEYFYMKEMIQSAKFDALFVQFYNNRWCDAVSEGLVGEGFNYDKWVDIIEDSDCSKDAKLYVGLPASEEAAPGGGYLEPGDLKDLVCELTTKSHFGGVSLWDLTRGEENIVGGKSYNEHVMDALKYGCAPVPVPTTNSAMTTTTGEASTSTDVTTTEASTVDTTTVSDVSTTSGASSTGDATSTDTTTASEVFSTDDATATSDISASTSADATASTDAVSTDTASIDATASTETASSADTTIYSAITKSTIGASATVTESSAGATVASTTDGASTSDALSATSDVSATVHNSAATGATATTDVSGGTESTASVEETKPATFATAYSTFQGWNTTSTGATAYTQIYSNPSTLVHSGSLTTKGSPAYTNYPGNTDAVSMTTSTVCTTRVHTVTKCPPEVADCSYGSVTTETIPLYITVCPVTGKANPTGYASQYAAPPQYETRTVYTTSVHTITKCALGVADCPYGSVITETVPVYTTICTVTEADKPDPTDVLVNHEIKTIYMSQVHTLAQCPPKDPNCQVGAVTTEIALWTTAIVPLKETQSIKAYKPVVKLPKPPTVGSHLNGTTYTSVAIPPATLKTATKPGIFEQAKPTYKQPAQEKGSGAAAPSGGHNGEAPIETYTPAPITPVTAGASSIAVGLTALAGIVLLQVLTLQ